MKKRKGLTLIEVVVSIALMGMVVLIFLTIFNTSNRNITKSGDRTDDIFEIQNEIDSVINSPDFIEERINKDGYDNIEVNIEGISESQKIKGKILIRNKDGVEITTFVPYEKRDSDED